MIFKNTNPNGFISKLMLRFQKEAPHLILRFNTVKTDDVGHHCIIKCSQTATKAYVNISNDGVKVVGYERVANIPANISRSHHEIFTEFYPDMDESFEHIFSTVKKILITRSESLLSVESGNKVKMQGVQNLDDLNENNVFFGIVRKASFNNDNVVFTLHNGNEITLTNDSMENLPGIGNTVGRYLVMNHAKEIAIMAPAKFQSLVKE